MSKTFSGIVMNPCAQCTHVPHPQTLNLGEFTLSYPPFSGKVPSVSERKEPFDESVWHAYGPQKQAWKKAGNYFTAEELERMEAELSDLAIRPIPRKVYDAN